MPRRSVARSGLHLLGGGTASATQRIRSTPSSHGSATSWSPHRKVRVRPPPVFLAFRPPVDPGTRCPLLMQLGATAAEASGGLFTTVIACAPADLHRAALRPGRVRLDEDQPTARDAAGRAPRIAAYQEPDTASRATTTAAPVAEAYQARSGCDCAGAAPRAGAATRCAAVPLHPDGLPRARCRVDDDCVSGCAVTTRPGLTCTASPATPSRHRAHHPPTRIPHAAPRQATAGGSPLGDPPSKSRIAPFIDAIDRRLQVVPLLVDARLGRIPRGAVAPSSASSPRERIALRCACSAGRVEVAFALPVAVWPWRRAGLCPCRARPA